MEVEGDKISSVAQFCAAELEIKEHRVKCDSFSHYLSHPLDRLLQLLKELVRLDLV